MGPGVEGVEARASEHLAEHRAAPTTKGFVLSSGNRKHVWGSVFHAPIPGTLAPTGRSPVRLLRRAGRPTVAASLAVIKSGS